MVRRTSSSVNERLKNNLHRMHEKHHRWHGQRVCGFCLSTLGDVPILREASAQRQNGRRVVPRMWQSANPSQPFQSELSLDAASRLELVDRQYRKRLSFFLVSVAEIVSLVINEAASFEYLEMPADVDESLARSCNGYSPDSFRYWRCCLPWSCQNPRSTTVQKMTKRSRCLLPVCVKFWCS